MATACCLFCVTRGQGWRQWIDLEHNICYHPSNHCNGLSDGRWKYILQVHRTAKSGFDLARDPERAEGPGGTQVTKQRFASGETGSSSICRNAVMSLSKTESLRSVRRGA